VVDAADPNETAARGNGNDRHDPDPGGVAEPEVAGALAAFRSREFTMFWTAGLISNTGTWMQTVTVPYVIDQLTHSTALVGVSAFCTFFPSTIVSPLGGSLADRHDRRAVLIWAQALMMVMAAALWALWSTGTATTVLVLVCVVIGALGAGLTMAAWQSFVPQLVPRNALLSAVRINSMSFTGARAFGPALAGIVLATLGPSWAFGLNAVSFLVVIGALLTIRARPFAPEEHGGVIQHFREGIAYARARPTLVAAIAVVTMIAFLGVAIAQLTEPIARHVFDVGPGVYGALTAAYGTGAVLGSAFTVAFGDTFRRSRVCAVGVALMVVGIVLLGVSPGWQLALGALFFMGAAQVLGMVSANTAMQLNVDERFRGRASALFTMCFFAAAPVGALIGGVVGEWIGLRVMVLAAAVLLAASLMWALVRYRGLRPLDASLPVFDEHGVAVPRAVPTPATDLDTAGHLVVEAVD
jgi:MFS family permease